MASAAPTASRGWRPPWAAELALPQRRLNASDVQDLDEVQVLLQETGEMFQATDCRGDMTVRELKEELELLVGLPLDLQRLQYLDQGVLMDETTLKSQDVVPGGIISLRVWHYDGWTDLVLAAAEGDPGKLSCLAVDEASLYRTANSQHLEGKRWKEWVSRRAFVALYVTSHRGHLDAMRYLLEHGANCLGRTPTGRTALHVAAAMGRLDAIRLLLSHGASIHDRDARGETPMAMARRMDHRHSERQMLLLCWMTKSGVMDPKRRTVGEVSPRVKSGLGSKKRSHV
ncbi:ankyrin repeat domain-containing protein 60 [Suricata suricatta]|uniref:ankyrin repeat domain-containing protein 60 n=1 Tax=Suricata suricatta TaxID=37032 RepID=UPI001155FBA9|nr:ankyrin repeat domain-containing protein 60 [Suricata suricatta]